ncbi:hypothetical protein D3C76_941850 [compost metagenome]
MPRTALEHGGDEGLAIGVDNGVRAEGRGGLIVLNAVNGLDRSCARLLDAPIRFGRLRGGYQLLWPCGRGDGRGQRNRSQWLRRIAKVVVAHVVGVDVGECCHEYIRIHQAPLGIQPTEGRQDDAGKKTYIARRGAARNDGIIFGNKGHDQVDIIYLLLRERQGGRGLLIGQCVGHPLHGILYTEIKVNPKIQFVHQQWQAGQEDFLLFCIVPFKDQHVLGGAAPAQFWRLFPMPAYRRNIVIFEGQVAAVQVDNEGECAFISGPVITELFDGASSHPFVPAGHDAGIFCYSTADSSGSKVGVVFVYCWSQVN